MKIMKINQCEIEDTFAEGFGMYASRLVITAETLELARTAATNATGYATSTIHCDCEAGLDSDISEDETPDGRPGVSVVFCVQKKSTMDHVLLNRLGQCVLTCPTTAVYDWCPKDNWDHEKTFEVKTGYKLKFFGDGYEEKGSINFNGRTIPVWNIPTMDGIFTIENSFKVAKIAGGGNFMVFGTEGQKLRAACANAIKKMSEIDGVIMPFPGGFVRSPSKLGSVKYSKFLEASTNEPLLPMLKDSIGNSRVPNGAKAGYEFVINGFDKIRVMNAMKAGILTLCEEPTVIGITAGNYDGKLGKIIYKLKKVLEH